MLQHEFHEDVGILVVTPSEPLTAEDFATLARRIDPAIEPAGALKGLLLDARRFPGWRNLRALLAHLRFVKDHHRKIRRIAVMTDERVLSVLPSLVRHVVAAEVRRFPRAARDEAMRWPEAGTIADPSRGFLCSYQWRCLGQRRRLPSRDAASEGD